jgi:hypothetical protein
MIYQLYTPVELGIVGCCCWYGMDIDGGAGGAAGGEVVVVVMVGGWWC